MAEDDDQSKRGTRDNTGRDHKPANVQNNENAPTGQLGTNRLTQPSLSLGGGSKRKWATQSGEIDTGSAEQSEPTQPAQDNRPIAEKTGVEEIDKQSEANGFQLKTMDEIKAMAAAQATEQAKGPEQSGDSFFETDNKAVNDMYNKTDTMIPKESPEHRNYTDHGKVSPRDDGRPKVTQSNYERAFRQAAASNEQFFRSKGQGQEYD